MQSKNLVIYNQRRQLSAALFTKLGPLWVTNGLHLWEKTMAQRQTPRSKQGMLKRKLKEKLQEDGISKEWMDKHLIIDIGDD
jgi:hypothetical protein